MGGERFARALIALLALARPASADVTAPRAVSAPAIAYPRGAAGDAEVVLEVSIDERGDVRDVRVLTSSSGAAEPFASAAAEGARAYRFEPARRDGVAVRARVRLVVAFHAPKVVAPSARDESVTEVRVRGVRADPPKESVPAAEVRQLPGAFGDPFRAIEALPGVVPMVSGVPFFFVRGAPPGNTGYFLDGVRVPLLFHLALGPGVVHPALIDKVDFYPGVYPARFGRFAGGVVAGETRAPPRKPHGELDVRLFDAGALLEAPIGERITALAAGRYSYAAALVEAFAPDTRVAYWDYQGRVTARVSQRDTISLFGFGSYDQILSRDTIGHVLGTNQEIKSDFYPLFQTEFHRLDLRWDHTFERGRARTAVTTGLDQSGASNSANIGSFVGTRTIAARSEIEAQLAKDARVRGGADASFAEYDLTTRGLGVGASSLYPPRQEVITGAWADLALRLSSRLDLSAGLRFDLYDAHAHAIAQARTGSLSGGAGSVALEPRVTSRLEVTRELTYVASFGLAHQPPSFIVPIPGLSIGRLNRGLQEATQIGQGIELRLPLDLTLTAQGFLHVYTGLTDATATCVDLSASSSSVTSECLDERVRGRAFGLEVLLRRPLTKRLTGWLSYTLSRSTRDTSGLRVSGRPFGEHGEIPADFDRTHVLALVGAYDLGAGWRAGARLQYYTGRPYSKRIGNDFSSVPIPPYNAYRMPDFARVDLRVEKAWRVGASGRVSVILEWLNATLAPEAVDVDKCASSLPPGPSVFFQPDAITCTFKSIGPISVPSVGFEGAF